MAQIDSVTCEVKCESCGKWSPSGIWLGSYDAYRATDTSECEQNCPNCGNMMGMNLSNMRFIERRSDGTVTYILGEDVKSEKYP